MTVAVDGGSAPEHPSPAAPNDAYAAYIWTAQHAREFTGDPARVAVGGESAGGKLATVVSTMARDKKAQMPVHRLLAYPVVERFELIDYKVRLFDDGHGTDAKTRVLIETSDGTTSWVTVGVGENVIEASWEALVDGLGFGLWRAAHR